MSDKNNYMEEPSEEMTVTLTLDDGSELECVVLTVFEAGGRDYIALLPMEGEDGNPDLQNIEDDEEYEIVADAFDELLDEQEYDELIGEDELDD